MIRVRTGVSPRYGEPSGSKTSSLLACLGCGPGAAMGAGSFKRSNNKIDDSLGGSKDSRWSDLTALERKGLIEALKHKGEVSHTHPTATARAPALRPPTPWAALKW